MKPLVKSKNCMACHAVDKKVVGPAYKEVAKKRVRWQGADATLVEHVMKRQGRLGPGAHARQRPSERGRRQETGGLDSVAEVSSKTNRFSRWCPSGHQ